MKLKVCGLKYQENIKDVLEVTPDFLGFIFYPPSPRFVGELAPSFVKGINNIKKVGVFVNASLPEVLETKEKYGLELIQLHGDESPEYVSEAKKNGLKVIKVFRINDKLPENLTAFQTNAELFLFDTDSKAYGGSGKQFDWELLKDVSHPFLLSGGIGPEDIFQIKALSLKYLQGIDVNSKVEVEPGRKSISLIKQLKEQL